MTGKVLATNPDNRLNRVGIYVDQNLQDYDDALYKPGKRDLKIEKTADKHYVKTGDLVEFKIKVSNLTGSYDDLILTDTLPKGLKFISQSGV